MTKKQFGIMCEVEYLKQGDAYLITGSLASNDINDNEEATLY